MPDKLKTLKSKRLKPFKTKEQDHYHTADWKAKRLRILVRDSFTCQSCNCLCYGKAAHVDHVQPLEDGGTDSDENLATRCSSCHGKKTRDEQKQKGLL